MYVCLHKTNTLRHWNITPLILIRASVWNAQIVLSTQKFFVHYQLFPPYPEYLVTDIFCLLKMTRIMFKFTIPHIKCIVFTTVEACIFQQSTHMFTLNLKHSDMIQMRCPPHEPWIVMHLFSWTRSLTHTSTLACFVDTCTSWTFSFTIVA